MRRIKRNIDFEITLDVKSESFIRPPRDAQRNWLINRALKEFSDDLQALDVLSAGFIEGDAEWQLDDRTHADLSDDQIMEDWQTPLMKAMVDLVAGTKGDILEIGFGRGVSSSLIQQRGATSHTIVECNEHVIRRFERWRTSYTNRSIRLIEGKWQDVIDQLGLYDGVFFHAYPLHADEFYEHVVQTATFAEPFFKVASGHLRPGGIFTYLSNEYDSLSRGHQRKLFNYFRDLHLSTMPVEIPNNSKDSLWGRSIVLVKAVK